jgi:short-subunit dehydrogenase
MKTALITGASAGLGVDFAHILAERRINLILVARSEERLNELSHKLSKAHNITCHVIRSDLALAGSAKKLMDEIHSRHLKVDILVNNAGYGLWGPFASSEFKEMAGMIQLNVNTLTELTRLALPHMTEQKAGYILNVASTAAFQPGPWMGVYYATKAYVLSFGEALAEELKNTGVSVTTLCPGPTKTEFFDRARMGDSRMKRMLFADSMACARTGIDAMFQRRAVVVDGMMNWMFTLTSRVLPRATMRRVAGLINASVSN